MTVIYSYAEGHYAVRHNAKCNYGYCQFVKCRSTIATSLYLYRKTKFVKCILCHYAEWRYTECRYDERHNAECRYAECRGAVLV